MQSCSSARSSRSECELHISELRAKHNSLPLHRKKKRSIDYRKGQLRKKSSTQGPLSSSSHDLFCISKWRCIN